MSTTKMDTRRVYIELLSKILRSLSNIRDDSVMKDFCSKGNFLNGINFKSFAQITYFLIKVIDEKLSSKLPMPVLSSKANTIFIKELFNVIAEIKEEHIWAKISVFQKSHFNDPRVDNVKVLRFLIGLSSTSARALTCSTVKGNISHLKCEVTNISEKEQCLHQEIENLLEKDSFETKKNLEVPVKLKTLKTYLVSEGLIPTLEKATLEELLKVKSKTDTELLNMAKEIRMNCLFIK